MSLDSADDFNSRCHMKETQPRLQCPGTDCSQAFKVAKIHHPDLASFANGPRGASKCLFPIGNHGEAVREDRMGESGVLSEHLRRQIFREPWARAILPVSPALLIDCSAVFSISRDASS